MKYRLTNRQFKYLINEAQRIKPNNINSSSNVEEKINESVSSLNNSKIIERKNTHVSNKIEYKKIKTSEFSHSLTHQTSKATFLSLYLCTPARGRSRLS